MNKKFLSIAAVAACMTLSFTACDDDDNNNDSDVAVNLECTADNVTSWGNYMKIVAKLLVDDATTLYGKWTTSTEYGKVGTNYANYFKSEAGHEAAEEIVDGCNDIANEVGEAKIGDPLNLYNSGETTEALYAVESWYSWHSRDDYSNNILSIRNSYYGSLDGTVSEKSLSAAVKALNPELDAKMVSEIQAAYDAIQAIPQPFRNHINSAEALAAQQACNTLAESLASDLKGALEKIDESVLKEVVANYVDVVVVPTYGDLKKKNEALKAAVDAFAANPSDDAFEACAQAWLDARMPWETSEAFLFGPVGDLGLDPNMDSWPLDQNGIYNVLTSGKYDDLNWSGDFDEDNDAIANAQALRGFHTLEYLIFKDGKARTIK